MTNPREIELKLDATARDLDRLERGSFLKSIGARKPRTAALLSVYFDTDKLKLRRKQLSLRLRRQGDRRLQTIKTTGNGAALLERGEWEQRIATDEPDLEAARGTALEPVLSKKVRRALKPVFETRVQRTTYPIQTRDSLVELAIDRGTIDTDRDSSSISEVELELKRGRPADLFRLARTLASKAPVELAVTSKAERGYRLYAGEKPAPTKALPLALDRTMRTQEAFQLIARACLQQLIANLPVLRDGDPEGLHQARVAIRRLRAASSLFSGILGDDQTGALKQELRWIAGEFGPARELHVLRRAVEAADHGPSDAAGGGQPDAQSAGGPPPAGLPALEEDLRDEEPARLRTGAHGHRLGALPHSAARPRGLDRDRRLEARQGPAAAGVAQASGCGLRRGRIAAALEEGPQTRE